MTRTIHEIRWEAERNREQLAETVDALRGKITETADDIRHKVSPQNIKEEVSGYVADKGRHWVNQLKQQAMENPMQTVAAGMAVAVPALKIARAIPFPLLMIGAGLALSSRRVRTAMSEQLPFDVNEVTDKAREATAGAVETATELAGTARERFDAARDAIRRTAHDARDTAASAYQDARDTISNKAGSIASGARSNLTNEMGQMRQGATTLRDVSERVMSGVDDAAGAARDKAAAASDTVTQALASSREAVTDYAARTADYATKTASRTAESAQTMIRENAVVVGALGLAIGAIIAAAIPATRVESKALGSASGGARRMASDAAEEVFDKAKSAVLSAADEVGRSVREADIGGEVSRAAGNMADKLKTVTDKTVTTAFEPDHSTQR